MKIYIGLCCAYCIVIITGNLICAKIVNLDLGWISFEVSVGVLLYPVIFLLMDLIVECFGKEWANYTVFIGILMSFVVMGLIIVSDNLNAVTWSPVSDDIFHRVFDVYGIASIASLTANYLSQSCDILIFTWLKQKTQRRHLWLRNNVSTIVSQFIDTVFVISIMCVFDILPWEKWVIISSNSFFLKFILALCDTPFCYLGHYWIDGKLGTSKVVEEVA